MNEQRTRAYLNLVNQLLSCNDGDEPRILQENQELVDQGLIEVMVAVARQLGEAGRENEAQWLMNRLRQLAQALGLLGDETRETTNTPQDYLNFLIEVLQKVDENPNPQLIYPFLAQNLDKLNENLINILDNWAKNTLSSVELKTAKSIAYIIVNFSSLIQQFPLGNIAANKEIAITGYDIALTVYTFDAFPQDWARTQDNLANAYRNRIRGDKAENLDQAIARYTEALKVYTFEAFPQDWAKTQLNLANTYLHRIRGDKADNLEQAIARCTEALKIYTFDAFPQEWATTQDNLAFAYGNRIRGDKADNLEQAIAGYREALKVYTFDAFPQDWAATQNNLAAAYYSRIREDKADNLEQAIAAYREALKVRTFDAFPQDWARTQHNLAIAYRNRIRGDKAENLEQAIAGYREALKIYTFEAFPQDWATTQDNLAFAYYSRIRGDKADNLEQAIAGYREALKVYTFDAFPQEWAMTQLNLANTHLHRIRGDKAENLDQAIARCTEALKVYTFEAFPQDWATTQDNLAFAYVNRIRGDKAENLDQAIAAYREALKVRTFEAFPQDWAATQNNLAAAYYSRIRGDKADNLEHAIAGYREALKVRTFEAFPQDWARTQDNLANAMKLQSINAHINQDLIQRSIIGQAYLTDKPIPVSSYSPPLAVDIPPTEVSDSPSLAVDIPSTEVSDSPSLARKNQPTSKNKNIRFIYFLEKLLYKIARSFVVLLAGVFTIVFSIIYLIIFPSYRRKMQSYGIYSKAEYPAAMLEFPPIHKPLQSISESRFIFLKETFLKVCINPNPKLIYPFWEKNLDKFALHEILDVVLQAWMIETLQKVTFYQAYCIALDLANFSQLIQHFPLGCASENLDTAIIGYKISLRILTFNAYPKDWAYQQYNLGNAYFNREVGNKEENLEEAIICFCAALKVYSRRSFSIEWARIQYQLGNAYIRRIRVSNNVDLRKVENNVENLEKAITCYKEALTVYTHEAFPQEWEITQNSLVSAYREKIQNTIVVDFFNNSIGERAIACCTEALKVYTFDAFPQDWAKTQSCLANAYSERIRGDKAGNLEQAIASYREALKVYTFDAFPQEWAATQNNLARAYRNRIRGDKADNLEQEIAAYHEALKVYTFDAFPQEWARTQSWLAIDYCNRIRGDKADNLEQAIACCTEALKVYTFDAFPQDWARTQHNLARAYRNRIRGDKADNLEQAIARCRKALKVSTFDAFPQQWAGTQLCLAATYGNRIRGEKAENLERAIACCTEALKVYTFEAFPQDWAMTQNNLASAYSHRIRGDKADNLEQAIATHHEALKVRTFDAFPQDWAMTQHNLAFAYYSRIRGEKAENLERAIAVYREALKVYTFDAFPQSWAMTQHNLALAYVNRIRGDKAENLEQAIATYHEALKVRTFDAFPQDWAATQNNLANAYSARIRGDKAENLEQAIAGYREALKVYTFDAFPQDWARTQHNLAHAYRDRIRGQKAENLERAIDYYYNALTIRTKEADPLACLDTARGLAILHYNEKQWQPATEAYHLAIEAVENARLEALNPQSRQETLSNAIGVFHRIVQAHLKLNQPEKALEYIERSKGRNLVELMTHKNVKPQGVSQEIIDKLDELRQRWVNEQIRLQSRSINQNISNNDKLMPYISDNSHLKEYRQAWEDFIDEKITPIDPNFKQTQIFQPIPFKDIQALTDAETCLLQWYVTSEKILAFIVSSDGDIKYWESSEVDLQSFIDASDNYIQIYYSETGKEEWINQLPNLLQTFADILHINDILALIPDTCKRLIIIPHRYLHILPLHAFPINESQILQDKYDVQYAPSCQLLQITKQRQLNKLTNLFAIQNPTKDLVYTDLEVTILSTFFTEPQVIAKDNATKNAVLPPLKSSDNHCYHFSCHGRFNRDNPIESALFLANKEPLTLGEIFELNFKKSRLVVLSACETGLIDLNSISDEYIGLPSGFLFAGSPSVVSSLWTVNDLSTSFLMIKFYEILFDENQQVSVPVALKQAQYWLQDLTIDKLDEFLQQYQPQIDKHLVQLRPGQRKIYQKSLERIRERQPYPFANPYYWAGFTATGI